MNFKTFTYWSLSSCLILLGCEAKPPAAKPATPQRTTIGKQGDSGMQDLQEFMRKDREATGTASLPPGHPPIPAQTATPTSSPAAIPAGHPPIPAQQPGKPAGRMTYDPPITWKPEPVKSSMRVAQYLIPRAEGDAQDGQMVIFYFGVGQGGPTDMNIARWKNMFTTSDGQPVGDDVAKVEKHQVGGLNATTLDVMGLYNDPMMVQSGSSKVEGEARMLATIVESPDGSYFFKAVGPKSTITANEANFKKLVDSVKVK